MYLVSLCVHLPNFSIFSIMPQLVKHSDSNDTYEFFLEFAKALRAEDSGLTDKPDDIEYLVHDAFHSAVTKWKCIGGGSHGSSGSQDSSANRVRELAESLVSANQFTLLRELFVFLIKDNEKIKTKFKTIFVPVVPDLVRILKERNLALDSVFCKFFFRWLIEKYLRNVLGKKTSNIDLSSIRKIGCGFRHCFDCQQLDSFILSTDELHYFQAVEARRRHLESRIDIVPHIATHRTRTEERPYTLIVTKQKQAIDALKWNAKQKAAVRFLEPFLEGDVFGRLLGERLLDARRALNGDTAYEPSTLSLPNSVARQAGSGSATTSMEPST